MCSSNSKMKQESITTTTTTTTTTSTMIHMNGRRVLEPNCNRVPLLERRNSINKKNATTKANCIGSPSTTPPASPGSKIRSPIKTSTNHPDQPVPTTTPIKLTNSKPNLPLKKSKKAMHQYSNYSSSVIVEAPGSIAAARREHVAIQQEQRKMRIAHYGRTTTTTATNSSLNIIHHHNGVQLLLEKRCSFITPNSDPIYVAYHDEEWGVPVHDDELLFELLVLTGAQVGSDWASVLRKRQHLRDAFSGFDAEIVSKFSEKRMSSISTDYGIELSQVRGVVDNSKRILEIKKGFGSFDNYLWGFVNNKPIQTKYKWCQKIPVKTSKSESISKDMVKRGFRLVGPTVIHSFMQAAGLTNDHLITCPQHSQCALLLPSSPTTSTSTTTTTTTTTASSSDPILTSLIIASN